MEEQQQQGQKEREEVGSKMINNLPIEIISHILVRLPVKPLLCLKTVCKSWLALITNADFADLHHRYHSVSSDRLFIVSNENYNLHTIDIDSPDSSVAFFKLRLPIQFPFESTSITGSCNGIICFRDWITSKNMSIFLFNPCTQEYKIVGDDGKSYISSVGLGYDSGEKEYKLVDLSFRDWPRNSWKTRIYSLKTNSWRFIEDDDGFRNFEFVYHTCPALIRNHLLHWIFRSKPNKIGCFDVCDERWKAVALPTFARGKLISLDLVVLDECLCLVTNDRGTSYDEYDVWIMKEYGVSWVKLLHLSDSPDLVNYYNNTPVAWSKDGRELLVEKKGAMGTEMFWYDLSSGTSRKVDFDWPIDYESTIVFRPTLAKLSTNHRTSKYL